MESRKGHINDSKVKQKEGRMTVWRWIRQIPNNIVISKRCVNNQRMKTNRILMFFLLCIFIGCKENNVKSEKTILSVNDDSISFSQESKKKEVDSKHSAFVVSCGSGCAMRYSAEDIIYNQSCIEVKFKIETFTAGSSDAIDYKTCLFYYDSLNEVSSVRYKGNTDNMLEELPADAQLSFKAFGNKIRKASPKGVASKSPLAKSNETLPYDKRIDVKTVKYNQIDSKLLKGSSDFLCDGGDKLRYLPLPNKGNIYLILIPMDCGDFDYRFYLLTVKNNTIMSNLYVEGVWFEPGSNESEEITSFRIDKNFSIKVKTASVGSPQEIRNYIIRDDGRIIEK